MAMYPMIEMADETLVTHSHVIMDGETKIVEVHFERPSDNCFDSARISLPSYTWIMRDGYSDDEIVMFEQMCRDGAHVLYMYAEQGGAEVAKAV
jgi:hypothetical protein